MEVSPGILLLSDGGIPGLLAAAAAADGRLPGIRRGSENRAFICTPALDEPTHTRRLAAATAQAQLYGLRLAPEAETLSQSLDPGQAGTRALVDACFLAQTLDVGTVLWPASAGPGLDGSPDLDRAASIVDRALLAGRLASVSGPRPVVVRAPYADLTDEELADLILDMDLPIWTCWWNQGPVADPSAIAEREHWTRLLRAAGWRGDLPTEAPAPFVSTPESPRNPIQAPRSQP
jgi:hypothetical protein